jgi:hypothetical protein
MMFKRSLAKTRWEENRRQNGGPSWETHLRHLREERMKQPPDPIEEEKIIQCLTAAMVRYENAALNLCNLEIDLKKARLRRPRDLKCYFEAQRRAIAQGVPDRTWQPPKK